MDGLISTFFSFLGYGWSQQRYPPYGNSYGPSAYQQRSNSLIGGTGKPSGSWRKKPVDTEAEMK